LRFGYELLAGFSGESVALLGGFRWEDYDYTAGALTMDSSGFPFAARLVLVTLSRPIVLEGTYSLGGDNKIRAGRINIPFAGVTYLSASWDRIEGTASSQLRAADLGSGAGGTVPATLTRLSFGLRVLSGAIVGM
jgi:hypothetical protein